ncbi:hypothetical protein ACX0GZ_05955 [Sphingomonas aestuarii]
MSNSLTVLWFVQAWSGGRFVGSTEKVRREGLDRSGGERAAGVTFPIPDGLSVLLSVVFAGSLVTVAALTGSAGQFRSDRFSAECRTIGDVVRLDVEDIELSSRIRLRYDRRVAALIGYPASVRTAAIIASVQPSFARVSMNSANARTASISDGRAMGGDFASTARRCAMSVSSFVPSKCLRVIA